MIFVMENLKTPLDKGSFEDGCWKESIKICRLNTAKEIN